MQACITGANGFIGQSLVAALYRQGLSIRVLTRSSDCVFPAGVQVVRGDLTALNYPLDQFLAGCEVIFHCAGEISDVATMQLLRIDGTQRLLQATLKEAHKVDTRSTGCTSVVSAPTVRQRKVPVRIA